MEQWVYDEMRDRIESIMEQEEAKEYYDEVLFHTKGLVQSNTEIEILKAMSNDSNYTSEQKQDILNTLTE